MPIDHDEQELRSRMKETLRRQMRALRNDIPPQAKKRRSINLRKNIQSIRSFNDARTIAAFIPIHAEADLVPLLRERIAKKNTIVLPRVNPNTHSLELCPWTGEELHRGAYGIPESDPSATPMAPSEIEFALVPALAADERGHRIGYGKGYYDRLIPTLSHAVTCVALFDFQLVAEVPAMEHDVPVDMVATDLRVIESKRDIET